MTRCQILPSRICSSRWIAPLLVCSLGACAAEIDGGEDDGKTDDGDKAAAFELFAERYPTLDKTFYDEIHRIVALETPAEDLLEACRLAASERRAAAFCSDVATFVEFENPRQLFDAFGVVAKPATIFTGARAEYVAATVVRVENAMRKAAPSLTASYATGELFDKAFGLDQPTVFEHVGGSFSLAESDSYVKVGNLLSTQKYPMRQIHLFVHELGHGFGNATFARSSGEVRLEGNHPNMRSIGVEKFPGLLDREGVLVGPDDFDSQPIVDQLTAIAEGGLLVDGSYEYDGEFYRVVDGRLHWVIAGAEPLADLKRFNDIEHGFRCEPSEMSGLMCGAYLMNVTISALPSSEEFADMFLNFTFDSFVASPAGDARYDWVEGGMELWLEMLGV